MPFGAQPLRGKKHSKAGKSQPNRAKTRLSMESLEPRSMLSASLGANAILAQPNVHGTLTQLTATSSVSVYTPAQIRAAYGFTGVSQTGAGQTIAIVDAYGDSTLSSDLHAFDQQFGIADPKLTVVNETGGSSLPANNSGWDMEISLDVEWAHAIAPAANIMLVEANSSSLSDLLSAVNYARNAAGVSVVSMSWGTSDFSGEAAYNSYFTTPAGHTPVTFVASSGDSGAGASWPAIANNVLAVGGTTLKLTASGSYGSESAWSGSGGGYSSNESESSYLTSMQNTGKQSDPDVAYDADPTTGFYVRDGGNWYDVGGTSAGAPQWSALIALANQGRAAAGKAALSNAVQSIMSLSSSDFHDITTGGNGEYKATVGYDVVTGRGTPLANLVVSGLIAATNPTGSTTASVAVVGAKAVSSAADSGGAAAVGNSGGSNSAQAAAVASNAAATDSASITSATGENALGASSISTADAATAKSAVTDASAFAADTPFSDVFAEDQSLASDASGDLSDANLSSQFVTDSSAFETGAHSQEAIEGLLEAFMSSAGSHAGA